MLNFNEARDDGVAKSSTGPYVNAKNHLHFVPDRTHQNLNFYRLAVLHSTQPTVSKHFMQYTEI